jgi:tRNA dimethylallyltransferase
MAQAPFNSIFVIGPTASGKTGLAVKLADWFSGEIISADSRQVYRRMDIGTGKDLHEYKVNGKTIPYHLIDVCEPGEQYNVERFYEDVKEVLKDLNMRNTLPIVCGGSGLYIEILLEGNLFATIPTDITQRKLEEEKGREAIEKQFHALPIELKQRLDGSSVKRMVRSLEIARYIEKYGWPEPRTLELKPLILGVDVDRNFRRERISARLRDRLAQGMIEEVEELLQDGLTEDQLAYYGLEYKWLSAYCVGKISYDEMVARLESAIHQFAKRQMTWFRRMERKGYDIHWVNRDCSREEIEQLWVQGEGYPAKK